MSFKTHLVAVSPTVPRLDILAHPEGGPEGAQAFIDRSMPGWRLTGETISMLTGRGVEGARYIGTWGPSALIQGDGTEVLARDLRARREDGDPTIYEIYELDVWGGGNSFSFYAVGDGISRLVEANIEDCFGPYGDRDDEDGSRMILETSGEPLPFEASYWYGVYPDGTYEPENMPVDCETFGEDAWMWLIGLTSSFESVPDRLAGLVEQRAADKDRLVMHVALPA